jgi:uncharacterized protein YpmS
MKLKTTTRLQWQQLPFIILLGLLVGAAVSLSVKVISPRSSTVLARAKLSLDVQGQHSSQALPLYLTRKG